MATIPAAVQKPAAPTVPLAPPGHTAPSALTGHRDDATDGSTAGSAMADGRVSEPEPMPVASPHDSDTGYQPGDSVLADLGRTEVPPLGALREMPGPGDAVGSVIQRIQALPVQSLQRTVDLTGAVPARAGHSPSPHYLRGTSGDGVADPPTQDPVVLALAAPVPRTGGPPGHADGSSDNVQRLSVPETPEAEPPTATAQVATPPGFFAPSSPAEAGNQAPPGDTALPEQAAPTATERPTAGAPGPLGAATPDQLEELAKRLAGPLIRRIKAEMLLDRERRGLRTDSN
ncbi:hypothetical protein [Arthrobacter globiformis]|nr:hypothetical protein [Arthrobacter globiformis]